MSRRGWALFAAMCLIWGIPYLLIKVAVGEVSPVLLVFMRTATGALMLLPVAVARNQLAAVLPRWRVVTLYTVVEIGVPWLLLSDAERRLSSSLSGLLVAAMPLIGAVMAAAIGYERIDRRRAAGLLIGFAGVATLLGFDVSTNHLGAAAEIGVVTVGYAIGALMIGRTLSHLPAIGVVTWSLGLTALAYLPFALSNLPSHAPDAHGLAAIVALGVVCTAIGFVGFFALIAEVGAVRATLIAYASPTVAVILGIILLGETFRVSTGAGFALIIAGCALATRRVQPRMTPPAQAAIPVAAECATD